MKILDLDIKIASKIRHNTKRNRMTIDGVLLTTSWLNQGAMKEKE